MTMYEIVFQTYSPYIMTYHGHLVARYNPSDDPHFNVTQKDAVYLNVKDYDLLAIRAYREEPGVIQYELYRKGEC